MAEARTTFAILPPGPIAVLRAHIWALLWHPLRYARLFFLALRHRRPGVRGSVWAVFRFLEAVLLAKELSRRGIDRLHSHFSNSGGHVGYLTSSFLKIPWSHTLHGLADFAGPSTPLLREKIRKAEFTAVVSYAGRANAMFASDPIDWDSIFVCRCGLDMARTPVRERAANVGHRLQILTVGRLAPEKCHLGLVEAFSAVVSTGCDAMLTILGEGPERARLEATVHSLGLSGRVRMPGAATGREVLAAMMEADLFVLSSLVEGLPVVLVEAMAVGTPILAPRLAGIPELVDDGRTGTLFTPSCFDELATKMRTLLQDLSRAEAMAGAGRDEVRAEFNIDASARLLAKMFFRPPCPRTRGGGTAP